MQDEMNITTLEQAEAYAASIGIALSPSDRNKIAAVQRSERERLQQLFPDDSQHSFADRWNNFYPKLLETIIGIGETVLTFAQTVIVALGVPLVLVLLLIVEHQRVVHGIALFEADSSLASFAALALVLLNLVLEFQVHYVEHRAGYEQARAARWSLRLWARNMAYRLGMGENWTAQQLSPAERYRRLLSLVTFSILALALAGSMRSVIEATPGAWYEALIAIVRESDLLTMLTWLGGLLFAAAAVLSAQGLSRYVAIRCVEIVTSMKARGAAQSDPYADEISRAGAMAALAIINDRQAKKAPKAAPAVAPAIEVAPSPFLATRNGNGNGKH